VIDAGRKARSLDDRLVIAGQKAGAVAELGDADRAEILFEEFSRGLVRERARRAFARRFDPRSDHLHHYSRATLAALIADFGFEQIAVRGAGGLPGARRVLLASAVRSRF